MSDITFGFVAIDPRKISDAFKTTRDDALRLERQVRELENSRPDASPRSNAKPSHSAALFAAIEKIAAVGATLKQ